MWCWSEGRGILTELSLCLCRGVHLHKDQLHEGPLSFKHSSSCGLFRCVHYSFTYCYFLVVAERAAKHQPTNLLVAWQIMCETECCEDIWMTCDNYQTWETFVTFWHAVCCLFHVVNVYDVLLDDRSVEGRRGRCTGRSSSFTRETAIIYWCVLCHTYLSYFLPEKTWLGVKRSLVCAVCHICLTLLCIACWGSS